VKSGITTVSAGLLCILVAVQDGAIAPRLDVPRGFTANLYARGIPGARHLAVLPDGRILLQGRGRSDCFEIAPPTADEPVTVMRVATELDAPDAAADATLAVHAPNFVQLRWNAASGELAYALTPDAGQGIPISPQTLTLARSLARHRHSDVALAPDGTLFLADSRAGAVWHIRRAAL
jgi:glucose/arabinose dehydrogenase